MSLKERARALKADIPAVYLCLKDKETPCPAKLMAAVTAAYALSPIDLIPDFIPVLGYLDDLILLPLFAWVTIKLIPPEVLEKNRRLAEGMWENGKPKKWYFALPIALFWALIAGVIIKAVFF